ncbi:MAG: mandelate racemase/muconate lactonizing enzyme family protein [Bryobacteraceae bacterium]
MGLLFRRDFLLAGALRRAPKMTLTKLEIFRIPVNARGAWLLTRIHTSAGISGIGDASHGNDERTIPLLKQYFEIVRGRRIDSVELLRREAGPRAAISGIEQCLWDIAGKAYGVPTYALFGGKLRDRVRNYANINRSTTERTPRGFAAMAERAIAAGFDAVKLAPFDGMPRQPDDATAERFTRLGIDCARAVRNAIGPKNDLLVDAHEHFTLARGLDLARRMEPLKLFWLEEVTPAMADLAEINRDAKMQTAGGEKRYGVKEFYPYIEAGAVDIVMPDVKVCGGMLQLKEIAALAEAAQIPVSPHGPASPVGNVAAAQVCVTMPNFLILEHSYGEVPWRAEIIHPPELIERGGEMRVSDAPGLGIEINEKLARRLGASVL